MSPVDKPAYTSCIHIAASLFWHHERFIRLVHTDFIGDIEFGSSCSVFTHFISVFYNWFNLSDVRCDPSEISCIIRGRQQLTFVRLYVYIVLYILWYDWQPDALSQQYMCKRSYSFFRGKWWFRSPGARLHNVIVFCHFYNSKAWVDFIVMKIISGKFFQTPNFGFNRRKLSGLGMTWGWVNKETIIHFVSSEMY